MKHAPYITATQAEYNLQHAGHQLKVESQHSALDCRFQSLPLLYSHSDLAPVWVQLASFAAAPDLLFPEKQQKHAHNTITKIHTGNVSVTDILKLYISFCYNFYISVG